MCLEKKFQEEFPAVNEEGTWCRAGTEEVQNAPSFLTLRAEGNVFLLCLANHIDAYEKLCMHSSH